MVQKDNEKLINRLFNYKFISAQQYLKGEDEQVVRVVNALAETFGNSGWIEGNMETIVYSCVVRICPQLEDEEAH